MAAPNDASRKTTLDDAGLVACAPAFAILAAWGTV